MQPHFECPWHTSNDKISFQLRIYREILTIEMETEEPYESHLDRQRILKRSILLIALFSSQTDLKEKLYDFIIGSFFFFTDRSEIISEKIRVNMLRINKW